MFSCTPDKVDEFHQLLLQSFSELVTAECFFEVTERKFFNSLWKQRAGKTAFYLWPQSMQPLSRAPKREGVPLLPIALNESGDPTDEWFSWRDVWSRETPADPFQLCDASFTFYTGTGTGSVVDLVLFRAEWPNPGSPNAGHPHWQYDITTGLDISGMHFGMAGWECTDSEHCWQRVPKEHGDIRRWAVKTLEYCKSQFHHFPVRA